MAIAALSIDLDSIKHYYRIHGLDEREAAPDPVYASAAERFGELCARLAIRGTAFCIGEELTRPEAAKAVAALAASGHEIANHSWSHDYRLARAAPDVIRSEVRRGGEAVERVAGRRAAGFRAPGYTLSAPLVAALADDGYRYDSSVFPAFPYWIAKAGVMAALSLAGRPSRAILDRPRVLLAPRVPYRPAAGEPYARGALPLLELPVTTGLFGFPVIGTFVATVPPWAMRAAAAGARRRPLVNVELHGIDLLDDSETPGQLAARRRDLRVPAAVKMARIERFVRSFGDREWTTLEAAATRVAPW